MAGLAVDRAPLSFLALPRRQPQRHLLAFLAAVAAFAHVPVIAPHLDEAPYMGVLFILLTVGCLVLGLAALVRDSSAVYTASAVVCGLAVIGYVATRLVAFPMLSDDVGDWFEPLGVLSVLSESALVAVAIGALASRPRHR
ncbi:hypothetical protein QDR37_01580 [Amnibacterium sp. CER49]|uniref:hypothetical protein n=1 Tax=Amnibacterium sp. CER49 TaxID=3039161 RepID=UPI00244C9764|nr:hypothetical protein [Amnibacterium sp. CER49]MDH2442626.1 hypothetical protein [Amnibacterium sp. CER49]